MPRGLANIAQKAFYHVGLGHGKPGLGLGRMSTKRGRIASLGFATLALFATPVPAQSVYAQQSDFASASLDRALEQQLRTIVSKSGGRLVIGPRGRVARVPGQR